MDEYTAIALHQRAGVISNEDAQKRRVALFRKYAFRQTLTGRGSDRFMSARGNFARDAEGGHQRQKEAAKAGDYETARWIKNEVIKPNERMVRAFDIARAILITGCGRIPDYPLELLPELQLVNNIAGELA